MNQPTDTPQKKTFAVWYKTSSRATQAAVALTGLAGIGVLLVLVLSAFRGPQMREADIVTLPQPEAEPAPPPEPTAELCAIEAIAEEELTDFGEAVQANRQQLTRLLLQTSQTRTGNWRSYASDEAAVNGDTTGAWLVQRYAARVQDLEALTNDRVLTVDDAKVAAEATEIIRELLELGDAIEAHLGNAAKPEVDFVPVGRLMQQLETTHSEASDLTNQRTFDLRVQEALRARGCIDDETAERF